MLFRSHIQYPNQKVMKASYKVCVGDEIEVSIPELDSTEVLPEPIDLDIVYEDHDIIVINKPKGMVVHPAPGHYSGTLVNALMGNKFYCTGTTGTLILEALKEKHPDEEWDFTILKSGPLGGDQQMGSRIVDGQIDYLFFFTDPMTLQPHDTDVKALTRLAGVENIVFCCNRSTADHIISSPLFMDPDYERIHPDYSSYTKRFQDKPVVTEAVESVNRRKKKRK